MKTADIEIMTAGLLLLTLFLFACQPPAAGPDAVGGEAGAPAANPLAQWIPRVVAIEGTCDAALYLDVGGVPVRVKADAAAGHDHGGADAGASVAIESALMSYACTYERGHRKACEQLPGVPVVLPDPPEPEAMDASEAGPDADDAPESGQDTEQ